MSSNDRGKKICMMTTAWILTCLLVAACEEHIIQRATSDYLQYETGNWWLLVGAADTFVIEVEFPDTIRQQEVLPVSYNGVGHFVYEADEALYEYVSISYTFSGTEYQVIDDFIARMELPFVRGSSWHDSVYNSIEVSGMQIAASYDVAGTVTDCRYSSVYDGDVYTIEITTLTMLETPDSTINDSVSVLEEYAPGIGIVRFRNETDEYIVSDYQVQ